MYKAIAKCDDSYAIINLDNNEVEALSLKDTCILMYFGIAIEGLAVSSTGDLIETCTIEALTEADIQDEDELYEDDMDFDFESDFDEFLEDEEYDEELDEEYYDDLEEEEEYEDLEEYDEEDDLGADWDEYTYDLEPEFEETKVSKLHKLLNPAQVKLLKSYYLWFSRRLFTDAQKDPTFGMKDKSRIATKTANLDALRNSGGMWKYAGFIDTGYDGGGYCTLGHKLRYMHIAWDVTDTDLEQVFFGEDYNQDIESALDSESCIIFGIKCISDFFEVDAECLASLKKAQTDSIKDMELMYDIFEEGNYETAAQSFSAMDEIVKVLLVKETKKKLAGKENECIIDPALLSYYKQFRAENMLVPQSLIYSIRDAVVGHSGGKFTQETWYDRFDYDLKSTFKERLNYIIGKGTSRVLTTQGGMYSETVNCVPAIWFMYWFGYKCCGYYEYDGEKYARDGGRAKAVIKAYNRKKYILSCFTQSFTMESAKQMLELYDASNCPSKLYDTYSSVYDSDLSYLARNNKSDFRLLGSEWELKDALFKPQKELCKYKKTVDIPEVIDKIKRTVSSVEYEIEKLIKLSIQKNLFIRCIYDEDGKSLTGQASEYRDNIGSIEIKCELYISFTLRADIIVGDNYVNVLRNDDGFMVYNASSKKYWGVNVDTTPLEQACIDKRKKYIDKVVEGHDKLIQKESKVDEDAKVDNITEVTSEDALNYLLNADLDEVQHKTGATKFSWHAQVLESVKLSNKEPSRKQMYYLNQLYEFLTGNKVAREIETGKYDINDYPDYLKAIKFVLSSDDNSFVSTVCKSVNKYGTFTEKQRKYLEEALQMYEESKK